MNYIVIFDIIIAGLGVYLIYSALRMKKSGEISLLLMNPETIRNLRDKKGFIEKIYKKIIIFGAVSVLFGLLGCINHLVYKFGRIYDIVSVLLYLTAWFWISKELRK